jgi:glycosyltransferase involved in cell wall biosynthesis
VTVSHHPVAAIVTVLDDAPALRALLAVVAPHVSELVVVDGGSRDDSVAAANEHGALVVETAANRGAQLDAGWRVARSDWLWLLHADSMVGRPALEALDGFVNRARPGWGRFDVAIRVPGARPAEAHAWQKVVSFAMNRRSLVTGICTGDQGVVVHRRLLEAVGGVPTQPLMEDIELSKRLRRLARPRRIRARIGADARRWRRWGSCRSNWRRPSRSTPRSRACPIRAPATATTASPQS